MSERLRAVMDRHDLSPRKSLGQNFLLDLNITDKIARLADLTPDTGVIEVGPGPGGLTRSLLAHRPREIVAIEVDARCLEALRDLADTADVPVRLIQGDALALDVASLLPPPRQIVANLPYNVATPLLIQWLQAGDALTRMTLMFQREVADRLVAAPGTSAYGRLSVMAQWCCTVDLALTLPARAFTPPPKVDSAVVTLIPRTGARARSGPQPTWTSMETIVAKAFGQRRKMLRGSLKGLAAPPAALIEAAGLDPQQRAETVSVAGFIALARAFEHAKKA